MSKLMRRAELQHKYDGILQWAIPRNVSIRISDYQKQETILEWVVDNFDFFCGISPPRVWLDFLDGSENAVDTPIEELLCAFKEDGPMLCEIENLAGMMTLMHSQAKQFLEDPDSPQPLFGLGKFVELYAEKEARLVELMEKRCQR